MNIDRELVSGLKKNRILVMTAVSVERDAVLRGLDGREQFDVKLAGVGPASAAAKTATALCAADYQLVISAGIAGGFVGRAEVGSIVVADKIVAADLGAQTADGFISLDELGFGSAIIEVEPNITVKLIEALKQSGLSVHTGAVLTVSTVTGTAATAKERATRTSHAVAEGMEGFGVATAAADRGIPVIEIRSISNPVGPRDRDAWRIKEALAALEAAFAVIREVLAE